jgi:hypothetical protein
VSVRIIVAIAIVVDVIIRRILVNVLVFAFLVLAVRLGRDFFGLRKGCTGSAIL